MFLFQKAVDYSTLRQGFTIPVEYFNLLDSIPGGMPAHGETRTIKFIIDGNEFTAQLKNQGFSKETYSTHKDVVQIRYSEGSDLVKYLRAAFCSTWNYIVSTLNNTPNTRIVIPNDIKEYLSIHTTDLPNVFAAECVTQVQKQEIRDEFNKMDELNFETIHDTSTGYGISNTARKIRKLDREVGETLKRLYGYCCQMTGEHIGEAYGANVVEAHHIIPFTESMNNDSSNILIISPSYHRIIHATHPVWISASKSFAFPNGLVEKVVLNKHL